MEYSQKKREKKFKKHYKESNIVRNEKKLVETMLVHVEAVRNIKNAVESNINYKRDLMYIKSLFASI